METPRPLDDADMAAAAPSTIVRMASGLVMVAGLAVALVGVQNLVGFRITGGYFAMLVGLVVLGVVAIGVGWVHGKARAWAALASLVIAVLMLLAAGTWLVVSFMGGGLSVMALGAVGLSGVAVVIVPFSLGPSRRATEAQTRLRDAGMDLGL